MRSVDISDDSTKRFFKMLERFGSGSDGREFFAKTIKTKVEKGVCDEDHRYAL